MDKDEVAEVKLWDTDGHHNTSTKRPSGAQLAANLNFDFPQVVRQHTLGVVAYLVWVLFTICSSFRGWKNFENRSGLDTVITISWVVHFLGHRVDGTRRDAIDGYVSDCCVLWPFDLISMSHVQVHTWPNFGENIHEDIIFTRFSGHCLLWPWPLTFWPQKLISTSMNPNTSVTEIVQNSLHWTNNLWQTTIFMHTSYQFLRTWNEPQN